jgi:hypothetical protein
MAEDQFQDSPSKIPRPFRVRNTAVYRGDFWCFPAVSGAPSTGSSFCLRFYLNTVAPRVAGSNPVAHPNHSFQLDEPARDKRAND